MITGLQGNAKNRVCPKVWILIVRCTKIPTENFQLRQ
uniref:Uncharacterized protein n=1 Tax=Rhizophora mucronata TaxID=61149 RepID=A0A2P2P3P5_RHIMU